MTLQLQVLFGFWEAFKYMKKCENHQKRHLGGSRQVISQGPLWPGPLDSAAQLFGMADHQVAEARAVWFLGGAKSFTFFFFWKRHVNAS